MLGLLIKEQSTPSSENLVFLDMNHSVFVCRDIKYNKGRIGISNQNTCVARGSVLCYYSRSITIKISEKTAVVVG